MRLIFTMDIEYHHVVKILALVHALLHHKPFFCFASAIYLYFPCCNVSVRLIATLSLFQSVSEKTEFTSLTLQLFFSLFFISNLLVLYAGNSPSAIFPLSLLMLYLNHHQHITEKSNLNQKKN